MYLNPFRDARVGSSDIDAGTDYCGLDGDPIYPVGQCRVLRTGTPSMTSTFGGDLSAYVLIESGPAKGLVIYTAEHYRVLPGHSADSIVDVKTPLYEFRGCIEQGWGTPDGSQSLAWSLGYAEHECSRLGVNFNAFMVTLGVAPGHPRGGNAPSGVLPAGFPDWAALAKDEAMYEDFKKGAQLYKDGKHLSSHANADMQFGWNFAQRSANLPDTRGHVHNVTVNGQTVQTSQPD